MHTVKVTTIGDSLGVVLPKAMIEHLKLSGDDYFQIEYSATSIKLTLCDADFAHQMEIVENLMDKRREVLRNLAE